MFNYFLLLLAMFFIFTLLNRINYLRRIIDEEKERFKPSLLENFYDAQVTAFLKSENKLKIQTI